MVGLPDAAVRESRDRVPGRLGLERPAVAAPADHRQPRPVRHAQGAGPASTCRSRWASSSPRVSWIRRRVAGLAFVGELGLDGSVRGVPGRTGVGRCPPRPPGGGGRCPVSARPGWPAGTACPRPTLAEVVARCTGRRPWSDPPWSNGCVSWQRPGPVPPTRRSVRRPGPACGPPGARGGRGRRAPPAAGGATGRRQDPAGHPAWPGLLPDLDPATAREVTRIQSAAGEPRARRWAGHPPAVPRPPSRGVAVAMIGGGSAAMRPGEIGLAHGGVLFLDELGEFPTAVLDALRQPLEDGVVRVSRSRGSIDLSRPGSCWWRP